MAIDFTSAAWRETAKWADEELQKARKKNDALLSAEETNIVRGEIRILKRLLSLPEATATMARVPTPLE